MATYSQISYGSQGLPVKKLQKLLNQGDYKLDEDGIFGEKTQAAVRDYQKNNGLDVDGIVGEKTWGVLLNSAPAGSEGGTGETAAPKDTGFNYGEYQESDAVREAERLLQEQLAQRPGEYQSAWQAQLNDLMEKILNREKFSYDLNGDALYQQYKDQYVMQGQQAMMDTMGQAQAMTGGYGNSYAQSVGQQAYQAQLQNLNDVVPELYQMALNQYNQEGQDMYQQYAMMGAQEEQDYGRHRDSVSDFYTELSRLMDQYNAERDYDYGKYTDDRNFEYGQYSDDRAYEYQEGRDQVADDQWQAEFDEAVRQYNHAHGISTGGSSSGDTGSGGGNGGNGGNGGDNGGGGNNYDTHGYTTEEIKALQRAAGITADGIWGPDTEKAYQAGYRPNYTPTGNHNDDPQMSDAAKDFMNSLPYLMAGGDYQAWQQRVDDRLEKALASGKLTEAEVMKIIDWLGLDIVP